MKGREEGTNEIGESQPPMKDDELTRRCAPAVCPVRRVTKQLTETQLKIGGQGEKRDARRHHVSRHSSLAFVQSRLLSSPLLRPTCHHNYTTINPTPMMYYSWKTAAARLPGGRRRARRLRGTTPPGRSKNASLKFQLASAPQLPLHNNQLEQSPRKTGECCLRSCLLPCLHPNRQRLPCPRCSCRRIS